MPNSKIGRFARRFIKKKKTPRLPLGNKGGALALSPSNKLRARDNYGRFSSSGGRKNNIGRRRITALAGGAVGGALGAYGASKNPRPEKKEQYKKNRKSLIASGAFAGGSIAATNIYQHKENKEAFKRVGKYIGKRIRRR